MTSPLPDNVDLVRVRGFWFDQDGGGSGKTVTFVPTVSNLTDAAAFSYIKTETVTVTVDPSTAYFFADLIASNDPDLTPSAWTVTLQGQTPFTIGVDYNATVQDVGGGLNIKAVWLVDAATVTPPPLPINSYYTSVQTNAAISEALDGFVVVSAVTSVAGRTGDVVLVEGDVAGLVADLAARTLKSTLTTKGDIYAASADSTPTRLGVGSNGQLLTADSTQTAGVKWADAPATYTDEQARDAVGAALVGGNNITVTVDDTGNTITIDADTSGTVTSVTAGDATVTVAGTASDPTVAVNAIPESKVTGLVTDLAGKQPADTDLTAIAALDSATAGALVTDGSGWIRKTYAQLKTALVLVKADVGLGNVDNTSNSTERSATATLTNKTLTAPVINSPTGMVASDVGAQPVDSDLTTIAALTSGAGNVLAADGAGWVSKTYAALKTALVLVKADVGLSAVDNTSNATERAATATLTNKTLTAPVINSPTGITASDVGAQPLDSDLTTIAALTSGAGNVMAADGAGWVSKTYAALKTAMVFVKADVGLSNVDNTSNVTERAATATLTNKTLTSPAITTPTGIVKGDVGLGSVDNVADSAKPVSSAQLTALNGKLALSTVTTKGDIVAATASATLARLAAGSNNQVLTVDSSTSTGLKWAAAASGSVASVTAGDATVTIGGTASDPTVAVSAATLAAKASVSSPTFTGTATFAKTVSSPVALTDAATVAVDASLGNLFVLTLGGNRTMGVPSTPSDGQQVLFEIIQDGTGSRTVTWSSSTGGYAFDVPAPVLATVPGARNFLTFVYDLTTNKWRYASTPGGLTDLNAADATIVIAGTATVPTVAVGTIAESQVTGLVTDLAGLATDLADLSTQVPLRGSVTNPNSTVTGSPGDTYGSSTGGPGATLWVKETGSATTTGWVVATPLSIGGSQCVQPFLLEATSAVAAPGAGNCNGTAFVADRSLTVSNFIVALDTAQVGGSLFRLGLYTVASNDAWTLVARSSGNVSDATTGGLRTIAFNTTGDYPATYTLTAGALYGVGVCHVGSTTAPVLRKRDMGISPPLGTPIYAFKRSLFVSGANECPTTIAATASWSIQLFWFGLT